MTVHHLPRPALQNAGFVRVVNPPSYSTLCNIALGAGACLHPGGRVEDGITLLFCSGESRRFVLFAFGMGVIYARCGDIGNKAITPKVSKGCNSDCAMQADSSNWSQAVKANSAVVGLLQGFTGAQPIVVLTFLALRVALSMKDLRCYTGKSADALTPALDGLEIKGLLVKQVGAHGKPYWMPAGAAFFNALGVAADLEDGSLFLPGQIPVFAESGATTTLINNKHLTSGIVVEAASQNPVFAESAAACRAVGIGEPKASKLSALPWVTPEFIRAHVAALGEKDVIGLAILRIENNETPPVKAAAKTSVTHPNGHPDYCRCHQCSMNMALVNAMQICAVCWREDCDDHE